MVILCFVKICSGHTAYALQLHHWSCPSAQLPMHEYCHIGCVFESNKTEWLHNWLYYSCWSPLHFLFSLLWCLVVWLYDLCFCICCNYIPIDWVYNLCQVNRWLPSSNLYIAGSLVHWLASHICCCGHRFHSYVKPADSLVPELSENWMELSKTFAKKIFISKLYNMQTN